MKSVSGPAGAGKTKAEIREFFSRKMGWLSERCRDPFITDAQFRVLYSLVVGWLHNESNWCKPTDEKLGESCAKSDRTIRRITNELESEGHIDKQKRLGPSEYVFIGLTDEEENESIPANLGQCNASRDVRDATTPANLGIKTGQVGYEDRPPVGRTKPSNLPSDLPTDHMSDLKKEEGNQRERVESPSTNSQPPAEPNVYTLVNFNSEKREAAAAAVDADLSRHPLYPELLGWAELESHLSAATSAELGESGSGAKLILAFFIAERMATGT